MTASDARLRLRERPDGRVVLHQNWRDILFLHWHFAPEAVQRTLPPGLFVDTYENKAWVAAVPFAMRRIRPFGFPSVPVLSNFLELNIRTYVHDGKGNYGVWFYALEANQPLAVWTARSFFHLNYISAKMEMQKQDNAIRYSSQRKGGEVQHFDYRIGEPEHVAKPESLEFFLIERYLLFSFEPRWKKLFMGRVHHAPYRICSTAVTQWSAWGIGAAGLPLPVGMPASALYSPGVNVETFGLTSS